MSKKKNKNYVLLSLLPEYDFRKGVLLGFKWHPEYLTREQLISKLASSKIYSKDNYILDSLSENMMETSTEKEKVELKRELFSTVTFRYKTLYFIAKIENGEYYKVNVEALRCEVDVKAEEKEKVIRQRSTRYKAIRRCETYRFRTDPVPNVHKYHSHRGSWYRLPKISRTARQAAIVEYKEFVKGDERRVNLPTWDDRPRYTDKSWKTSYKCKKQWMKRIPKHDGVYIESKKGNKSNEDEQLICNFI